MNDATETLLIGVLGTIFMVSIFLLAIAFGGGLFYMAWNFFLVPVAGVTVLSFPQCIGGAFAVGILKRIFTRRVQLVK